MIRSSLGTIKPEQETKKAFSLVSRLLTDLERVKKEDKKSFS